MISVIVNRQRYTIKKTTVSCDSDFEAFKYVFQLHIHQNIFDSILKIDLVRNLQMVHNTLMKNNLSMVPDVVPSILCLYNELISMKKKN